jgi:signal transduction histidine kinase
VERVIYRDPFHELRCEPACVQNPWLRVHAPDLLRGSERVLAVLIIVWAVAAAAKHIRLRATGAANTASTFVVLAIATVWAARLLQQPRAAPGDVADRWSAVGLLVAVAAAAALRASTPIDVLATRRRISHFANALSSAGDPTAISQHLRNVTGDESLDVELGDQSIEPSGTSVVTTVMRGGRVVATIHHDPSSRSRIAAAVTPATALALETQLLLLQAREQLVELETSRATAVQTIDEARRRLERDLHDGAQQRLLVVGMDLAHAAEGEAPGGPLRTAASRVAVALSDLRRIGRGDAAIIAELGLDDAVLAVAGTSDVPMSVASTRCGSPAHDCWPQAAATTAYRLVHASLAAAQRSGAEELAVELRCLGVRNGRVISTRHGGDASTERGADHDRVVASGGRIVIDDGYAFEVWLP